MGKKVLNLLAKETVIQINSTLSMLLDKHLCIGYNLIDELDYTESLCRITWNNHHSGRNNSGKSFTKLAQYLHILSNNSYHCLLFDGSLVRVNFQFENNILVSQNLLWWPAPYNYSDLLQLGFSPVQIIEDLYSDPKWFETIKMRSPIRIDFDSTNDSELHPKSHMHIQHEDSRLVIQNPICFNRFIDFIFRNFYPGLSLSFSSFDFIDYKIPSFEEVNYFTSEVIL